MKKGFTLVELVIVIVIVGILSIIGVREYRISVEKALMTDAVSNLRTIVDANVHYYLEYGCWQPNITKLGIEYERKTKIVSGGVIRISGENFMYSSACGDSYTTVHKIPEGKKYAIGCDYDFNEHKYTYRAVKYSKITYAESVALNDFAKKHNITIIKK